MLKAPVFLPAPLSRRVGGTRPLARAEQDGQTLIVCRHCKKKRKEKWRGLCRKCFDDSDIRNLYPSEHRAHKDTDKGFLLAAPTTALPGTEAKVKVLTQRAAQGRALFNDVLDAALDTRVLDQEGRYMDE